MPSEPAMFAAPLPLLDTVVESARTNVLGHMRAAEYVAVFDDAFLEFIKLTRLTDASLRYGATSPFLLDLHATYLAEVKAGDRVTVSAQALDVNERRARLMLVMSKQPGDRRVATCELAILNFDMTARRPVSWAPEQSAIWAALRDAHRDLAVPSEAGRAIGGFSPK